MNNLYHYHYCHTKLGWRRKISFNRLYKPDDKWNINLKQNNYFMLQFCVTISEVIYSLCTRISSAWNGIKIVTTRSCLHVCIYVCSCMCALLRRNITIIVTLKCVVFYYEVIIKLIIIDEAIKSEYCIIPFLFSLKKQILNIFKQIIKRITRS